MAYQLIYSGNQTGGNTVISVPDGSTATIGNIILPGKNYSGYGSPVDQNMLSMVENWASSAGGPSKAVTGQLWYDNQDANVANCYLKYNISKGATPQWATIPKTDANGNLEVTGNLIVRAPGIIQGDGSGISNIVAANVSGDGSHIANLNASALASGTVPASRLSGTYTIDVTGNLQSNGTVDFSGAQNVNLGSVANLHIGGGAYGQLLTTDGAGALFWTTGGNGGGGNGTVLTTDITTGSAATAGNMTGTWTLTAGSSLEATYADLAERHHSDGVFGVGTVMKVGGANEVTQATHGDDAHVLGVVSTQYAYLMNGGAGPDDTHPAIAYVGRVPVRVIGPVNKFDQLVPTLDGCARASIGGQRGFGWALETNHDPEEKLVLCIIK